MYWICYLHMVDCLKHKLRRALEINKLQSKFISRMDINMDLNCALLMLINRIIERAGKATFTLVGNSMYPLIKSGETVAIHKYNYEDLEIGDVIAYRQFEYHITVHRISSIMYDDSEMLLKTKGDNNKNEDCYLTNKNQFLGIVYKGFENTDLGTRV